MNWDAISAVSETIASIAVVISLIYLAMQIRQTNKLSQSQTRTDLRHFANAEVGHLVEHPDIWLLMWKDKLSPEEQSRLHSFLIGAIRFREFIWRQYHTGLLDRATFEGYIRVVPQLLSFERTERWWREYGQTGTFDPGFVTYVDNLLVQTPKADLQGLMERI